MTPGKATISVFAAFGRICQFLAMFCLVFVHGSLVDGEAFAQSGRCDALRSQLQRISTGNYGSNAQRFQKYDRAVKDQNLQIRKTERAWETNGCNNRRSNVCNRITLSLRKMMANLGALKVERARLSAGDNRLNERNRILVALQRNGCDREAEPANQGRTTGRRSLLEQIFGTRTYSSRGAFGDRDIAINRRFGTFRTLCVRTCDGYYFPISFSTVDNRFEQDLAQCQSMCPGTDVSLFFHPMPNGDAEEAISYRTGEPYTALQNAFAYRERIVEGCSCKFDDSVFQQIAGAELQSEDEAEDQADKQRVATPIWRMDQALSTAEIDNRDGMLTVAAVASIVKGDEGVVADGNETGSKIRIVGPAFFPVQ